MLCPTDGEGSLLAIEGATDVFGRLIAVASHPHARPTIYDVVVVCVLWPPCVASSLLEALGCPMGHEAAEQHVDAPGDWASRG